MVRQSWGDFDFDDRDEIGRGGMGVVYRGLQTSLNRPVAIKVLRSDLIRDPSFVERFRQEAELVAKLVDPHVVQVFGAGERDGQFFFAMELVPGVNLADLLADGVRFSPSEVVHIAEGVALALRAAWKCGIVHRDIKPANILLLDDGSIKVTDFGLARHWRAVAARPGMLIGTPRYLAPEEILGQPVDIRVDIYAVGVVLFELATGEHAHMSDSPTAVLYDHVHHAPQRPRRLERGVPRALETVILTCLEKDPGARYASPDDLLTALGAVRRSLEPDRRAPAAGRRLAWSLAVVGSLLLGGALVWLIPGLPGPSESTARLADLWSERWIHESIQSAADAFGAGDYLSARSGFEEALAHMPPDHPRRAEVAGRIEICGYWLDMEAGAYARAEEAARRLFGEDSIEFREATWRRRRQDRAVGMERAQAAEAAGDWAGAAAAYEGILATGAELKAEEVTASLRFCGELDAALREEASGNLISAVTRVRALRAATVAREGAVRALEARLEERLAAKFGADVRAWTGRASALRLQGRWAEALSEARKALLFQRHLGVDAAMLTAMVSELEAAVDAPPAFVFVPAGPFPMGSDTAGVASRPRHSRSTRAFYMAVREVTRREYRSFLESPSARLHDCCPPGEPAGKDHTPDGWTDADLDAPVTGVDAFDAAAYAAWAGHRLPTEEEWEKAAGFDLSTGAARLYPWGDAWPASGDDVSFFGCRGMSDAPREWTASRFVPYPASESADIYADGSLVVRGGGASVVHREGRPPGARDIGIGFRCVRDIVQGR